MAANNLLDEMIEKGDTSPKTASEAFANFLNDMLSHENDYLFDTASVRKVWDYANSPYIAQWDIQNLIPSFHMDTARVSPVDTLQVKRGNLEDLIRELSHGVQYNKPYEERQKIAETSWHQYKNMDREQRYGEDWTHEGEAHMKIEPELWKMLEKKGFFERFMDYFK